jgi:hypothetical protein
MKLLLAVLSLYSIIILCYSVPCAQLPPGLDRLSHGIDVTRFDLFPPDLTGDNGYVKTIFDFTCNKQKKWQNPYTNIIHDQPDQIESIVELPGGILDSETEISMTYQERSKATAKKFGLNLFGCFSFARSHQKSNEDINAHKKVLTSCHAHVSAYTVELAPSWKETVGATMKHDLDLLPNTYNVNPNAYQDFVNKYGTHYFEVARYGGVMNVESQTNIDYASKQTGQAMSIQAGISYFNIVGINGGHTQAKKVLDKGYEENTITQVSYYGGTANPSAGIPGFHNWMSSAQKDPWIFGGQMQSIQDFIPEGPKKAAIGTAIAVKLDWAYLDELLHSLAVLKLNPNINKAGADNFVAQVKAERAKPIPPHDRVVILGQQVEAFVNAEKGKGPAKPLCKLVYNPSLKKNVCVNPATCICNVH